jgi:hypothetical protein
MISDKCAATTDSTGHRSATGSMRRGPCCGPQSSFIEPIATPYVSTLAALENPDVRVLRQKAIEDVIGHTIGGDRRAENLAGRDGWFVPVGPLLDHLRASHACDADPGYWYELALDIRWLADRIVKWIRYRR